MIIDRKYEFIGHNPCKPGKIVTQNNAVVFEVHDRALVAAIEGYINECKKLGCGEEHILSMELLKRRVQAEQILSGSKIPDTDTHCEIERCVGGKI